MLNLLIGRNPLTTIAGYVVAVLTAIHESAASGAHGWQSFLLPVAIALFGRLAADGNKKDSPPDPPSEIPEVTSPQDSNYRVPTILPEAPNRSRPEDTDPIYQFQQIPLIPQQKHSAQLCT